VSSMPSASTVWRARAIWCWRGSGRIMVGERCDGPVGRPECLILRLFEPLPANRGYFLGAAARLVPRMTAFSANRQTPRQKETPTMKVELKVNGKAVTADVPPNTLLVQLLREHRRLTGTHVGCDTGQCGACTVI